MVHNHRGALLVAHLVYNLGTVYVLPPFVVSIYVIYMHEQTINVVVMASLLYFISQNWDTQQYELT